MASNEASLLIRIKQAGGEVLDKISGSLSALADTAMAVGTAVVGFGVAAVAAFRESEKASNELTQAMINQGVYTTELKDKYTTLAAALQAKTQFDDDAIVSAQATLQTFAGQKEVTAELTVATLNLAAAKGIDLKSAAELVGKTIGSETNMLARQGVQLDESAAKTDRMAAVTQALNDKFGGQAEAAAKGLGSMEQLKNVAGDFLETVGEMLAPFVVFFTRQLIDFTTNIKSSGDVMGMFQAVIDSTARSIVVIKNLVAGLGEVIGVGLSGAFETVSLVMSGEFKKAKDMAAMTMDELKNVVVERTNTMYAEIAEIDNTRLVMEEQKRQDELANIQRSEDRKVEIKKTSAEAQFTEEQKKHAKLLGLELKTEADLDKLEAAKLQAKRDTLSTMAGLHDSSNKALAAGSKAFAAYEIAVSTPQAISKALAAYPPPFNYAAAGLVAAAMAKQAAALGGVKLAEGGIVRATPGGIQATIGEGGRDEAVIPLDDPSAQERLGGGRGATIIFNGPVLGDENQAMEFARHIDKALLRLRQSNQSVAFETDIF